MNVPRWIQSLWHVSQVSPSTWHRSICTCTGQSVQLLWVVPLLALAEALPASSDSYALALQSQAPLETEIFRARDWKGATDVSFGGCNASSGEYTVWVYATAATCGVPPEKATRVVVIRQPLPGVAPIRTTSHLPSGRYNVWVYGAGDPGHPWLNLCAKTCAKGELPPRPGWVTFGHIEVRDLQLLFLRSWQQPEGHALHIQAVVLSLSETQPDWVP